MLCIANHGNRLEIDFGRIALLRQTKPPHILDALKPCSACSGTSSNKCDAMTQLKAAGEEAANARQHQGSALPKTPGSTGA